MVLLGPHLTIISELYNQPELIKEFAKSGKLEQTKNPQIFKKCMYVWQHETISVELKK